MSTNLFYGRRRRKSEFNGQFAKILLYSEVPIYIFHVEYVVKKKKGPRKRGAALSAHEGIFAANTLGRLHTVHPKQRECFYLRLLLINVRGPTLYEYSRTIMWSVTRYKLRNLPKIAIARR